MVVVVVVVGAVGGGFVVVVGAVVGAEVEVGREVVGDAVVVDAGSRKLRRSYFAILVDQLSFTDM